MDLFFGKSYGKTEKRKILTAAAANRQPFILSLQSHTWNAGCKQNAADYDHSLSYHLMVEEGWGICKLKA